MYTGKKKSETMKIYEVDEGTFEVLVNGKQFGYIKKLDNRYKAFGVQDGRSVPLGSYKTHYMALYDIFKFHKSKGVDL